MGDEFFNEPAPVTGDDAGSWRPMRSVPAIAAWVVAATLAGAAVPWWSQLEYRPGMWVLVPAVALVIVAGVAEGRARRIAAGLALLLLVYVLIVVAGAATAAIYWDAVGSDGHISSGGRFLAWKIDMPLFFLSLGGVLVLSGMATWRLLAPRPAR